MFNLIPSYLFRLKIAIAENADGMKTRAEELMTDLFDDFKDKVSEQHEYVAEYAGNKPLQTIGVSLLVGGVIGWLMRK